VLAERREAEVISPVDSCVLLLFFSLPHAPLLPESRQQTYLFAEARIEAIVSPTFSKCSGVQFEAFALKAMCQVSSTTLAITQISSE
jgi:hypothetical protein